MQLRRLQLMDTLLECRASIRWSAVPRDRRILATLASRIRQSPTNNIAILKIPVHFTPTCCTSTSGRQNLITYTTDRGRIVPRYDGMLAYASRPPHKLSTSSRTCSISNSNNKHLAFCFLRYESRTLHLSILCCISKVE